MAVRLLVHQQATHIRSNMCQSITAHDHPSPSPRRLFRTLYQTALRLHTSSAHHHRRLLRPALLQLRREMHPRRLSQRQRHLQHHRTCHQQPEQQVSDSQLRANRLHRSKCLRLVVARPRAQSSTTRGPSRLLDDERWRRRGLRL